MFLLITTPMLVLACGGVWEQQERSNEGVACLEAPIADAQGTVYVVVTECLSSSCDRDEQGSCSASLDGDTITVTSGFTWETALSGVACNDDCNYPQADCTIGPLAAGTYTLVHGDQQESFTVPTTEDCEPW